MAKEKKVLLITNIPTPYRIPLFNELNKQLLEEGLKLKVVFGALSYERRKWTIDMSHCKFDYEILNSKKFNFGNIEQTFFSYGDLLHIVKKENPETIITNGYSIATMKLWLRSWFIKSPYIIWTGSIKAKGRHDSLWKNLQRRILIKRAIGFIVYGIKAKNYLTSFGVPPSKIFIATNTVDTKYYMEETKKNRKKLHGTSQNKKKHLLYVGHLSPRKNVIKLLKVIDCLAKSRSDFLLDIVGDGEDRKKLEKYAAGELSKHVKFHGFKQKEEIALYLAESKCFLFQTDFDIWGLVLIEAMAAGLPCISSINAGATHDLIEDGVTGFAMDFAETNKVTKKIKWILENPELAKEIGQAAKLFIEKDINLKKSAAGFVKALQQS